MPNQLSNSTNVIVMAFPALLIGSCSISITAFTAKIIPIMYNITANIFLFFLQRYNNFSVLRFDLAISKIIPYDSPLMLGCSVFCFFFSVKSMRSTGYSFFSSLLSFGRQETTNRTEASDT